MMSDLIMVLANILLVGVCAYATKTKYRIIAIFTLYLSGFYLFFMLATNIPFFISSFTPKHHGRVIDAETKKPLAGINIKAGWHVSSASVGGVSGYYYKIYKTKTDTEGKFVIPMGVKALTIYSPVSKSSFEKVILTIYPEDYQHQVERTHYVDGNESTIAMKKIKADKDFLDNILAYYYGLFLMHKGSGDMITDPGEIKWLKNSYYHFEKLYPYSREDKSYLQRFVSILDKLKQPDCLYLLNKLIAKYPDNVTYTKGYIELLKQEYWAN